MKGVAYQVGDSPGGLMDGLDGGKETERSLKEHILKLGLFWSRYRNHLKNTKSIARGPKVLVHTPRGVSSEG